MNENVREIRKQLWKYGIDIRSEKIKSFLLSQRSSGQIIQHGYRRRINEVSRQFEGEPRYFATFHSDICFINPKYALNAKKRLVITVICQISGYAYIENVASTGSKDILKAMENIFKRAKYIDKNLMKIMIVDQGIEYTSKAMQEWCKMHNIKINYVRFREGRGGKGAVLAENFNRRLRRTIQSIIVEKQEKNFDEVVRLAETTLNNEKKPSMSGLSAFEIVTSQDPRYIVLLKQSKRISKRKLLRQEIAKGQTLRKFDVVRIRLFKDKNLFHKESYGSLSDKLYIVTEVKMNDLVFYYKLGCIWTLENIGDGSYSSAELVLTGLSYGKACYVESLRNVTVVNELNNNMIEYKIPDCAYTFVASKKIL